MSQESSDAFNALPLQGGSHQLSWFARSCMWVCLFFWAPPFCFSKAFGTHFHSFRGGPFFGDKPMSSAAQIYITQVIESVQHGAFVPLPRASQIHGHSLASKLQGAKGTDKSVLSGHWVWSFKGISIEHQKEATFLGFPHFKTHPVG